MLGRAVSGDAARYTQLPLVTLVGVIPERTTDSVGIYRPYIPVLSLVFF
jgi:hypothetical protein